uniref:F-box domain-containing protein n=1 Tax=Tetradesmus obliquus TaxID=3088 RepID=A0A383VH06_TETOB|eukprot:jgi/Sobl393_1/4412/SZX63686.1
MDDNDDVLQDPCLPQDALRSVFSYLDCHSLCSCSCVCRSWRTLAAEDGLWQVQLSQQFYRPAMLQHYSMLASHHHQLQQARQLESTCSQAQQAVKDEPACMAAAAPARLKQVFKNSALQPSCKHQALLARFHTAMASITAWRLMIRMQQSPQTATAAATAGSSREGDRASDSGQGQQQQPEEAAPAHTTAAGYAAGGCSSSALLTLTGYPLPLSLEALAGGSSGWCCGCVQVQQQEQSCWVRFNLPAALKQDSKVAEAADKELLEGAVQALGPCGWFDVACAAPFVIADDDMEILLQSHKTGFYAWDQAEEDGVDRQADMQQLPWDVQPGGWQQQQQQQELPAADGSGFHGAATVTPPTEQQEQQQQQQPKLRMLVYIHYEQLLQVLPWQLPQQLLLPALPVLGSMPAIACHLAARRSAALWLQLDVCQLQGGAKLGSCVAPLAIAGLAAQKLAFEARQQSVLVTLYDPSSGKNSSCAWPGASQQQQQQQQQQHLRPEEEDCELLLLGRERIRGGGNSRSGLPLLSAADVLLQLLGRDEFMVDFALFDGSGTLLMGRAGVEVWAKELVSWHTREPCIVLPPNAQQGDAAVAAQAAAQAAQAAAPGAAAAGSSVRHERTVHMLHFLVDGVDGSLWENGLMVDAEPAPAGVTQPPLLKLNLTWAALHGLYGTKQQQQVDGTAEQDSAYQVGDTMQEMMAALGGG